MNLLERIKKLAKERDISIYQLEEEINIGRNTIYQWNKRTPSSDKLEAVANYFNVSVDYLLGRTDKKTANDQPFKVDIKNDDVIFAFDGKPVSEEEREFLLSVLESYRKTKK